MELVTLAHVILNRVGSASRAGMVAHTSVKAMREVENASAESLAALVTSIGVEHGEQPAALLNFEYSKDWSREGNCESHVFNVHGPNTMYGAPYAVCWVSNALKINGKYFRLDELKE